MQFLCFIPQLKTKHILVPVPLPSPPEEMGTYTSSLKPSIQQAWLAVAVLSISYTGIEQAVNFRTLKHIL